MTNNSIKQPLRSLILFSALCSLFLWEASAKDTSTAKGSSKAQATKLQVTLPKVPHNTVIPAEYAFCVEDGKGKAKLGANKSPEISWSGAPSGTQSFVLLAVDPVVPSKADHVNKEGVSVSKDLPRVDFYHWVLVDIPKEITQLPTGAESAQVVAKGKPAGAQKHGIRGLNNYTDWFASNKDMSGNYAGYDGPCPPWNDELIHAYHFKVFALDIPSLKLTGDFKGPEVMKAMRGHILASGESVGLYKLNRSVKY